MSSIWDTYPADYRAREIQFITRAVQAGECAAVVGLSGSGKSNLMGFLAHRLGREGRLPGVSWPHSAFVLVDCNRLPAPTSQGLLHLLLAGLGGLVSETVGVPTLTALDEAVAAVLSETPGLCLQLDRFDALFKTGDSAVIAANLRALRDAHKYALTFVVASRQPIDPQSELAELFFGNTLWLGPLNESDARWNIQRYTTRHNQAWDEITIQRILQLSGGYPAMLRAVCEAYAAGSPLEVNLLAAHPAVRQRVDEFWVDQPVPADLERSGLNGHPLLTAERPLSSFNTTQLTAKEMLLWSYFQDHPNQVCEKDDIIQAVWPEDRIFERGVRDDSLAQLVRRLREKIEEHPSSPRYIHTVTGRGYQFTP